MKTSLSQAVDWRSPRSLVSLLAILALVSALFVVRAHEARADAGNPIVGTIKGTMVVNPPGTNASPAGCTVDGAGATPFCTVTVYVRGEWNWLTHSSDCNFDRAGAGLGIIWNDPTETGYTVAKGTISRQVGIQTKNVGGSWPTDPNLLDQMVHPADRGNIPKSLPGVTNPPFGANQGFHDPSPPNPASYASWKGGCGKEPLAGGTYSGHPWGSWGYEGDLNDGTGQGYKHTYRKQSDITQVCVNFYDVHGGGTATNSKFQLPGGAKEITVNGNGDNSIQTNSFSPQGGFCLFPLITTSASSGGPNDNITDTATLTGGSNPLGTITFTAYTDSACQNPVAGYADSGHAVPASPPKTVTSDPLPTPVATGTYYWIASYVSSNPNINFNVSSGCGDPGETSTVTGLPTTTETGQKVTIQDFARVTGTGTLSGSVRFRLYDDLTECQNRTSAASDPNALYDTTVSVSGASPQTVNTTAAFTALSANGTYYWGVDYSGGGNNLSSSDNCTERVTIVGNVSGVDP